MVTREDLAKEALSFLGTPYVRGGRIKGPDGAVDCATFIATCLVNCGLSKREDLGIYSDDWFLHTTTERYYLTLMRHARKVLDAIAYPSTAIEPGCILLTRCAQSKFWNHGAIAIGGNSAVHAIYPVTQKFNVGLHPMWAYHEITVFDPFLNHAG